jgi:hypothetical protein
MNVIRKALSITKIIRTIRHANIGGTNMRRMLLKF